MRHGLVRQLEFTEPDCVEKARRIADMIALMVDAGLIVLVSMISPFRTERLRARERCQENEFVEVYRDTSLSEAAPRDPKGLYRKARRGELKNFTGIDSPYEPPVIPQVHIDTSPHKAEHAAELIIENCESSDAFESSTSLHDKERLTCRDSS